MKRMGRGRINPKVLSLSGQVLRTGGAQCHWKPPRSHQNTPPPQDGGRGVAPLAPNLFWSRAAPGLCTNSPATPGLHTPKDSRAGSSSHPRSIVDGQCVNFYCKHNESFIHTYAFFLIFFSIMVYHRILTIVPYTIQ